MVWEKGKLVLHIQSAFLETIYYHLNEVSGLVKRLTADIGKNAI